jgi:Firmicute plasmid replication protein (RepL)
MCVIYFDIKMSYPQDMGVRKLDTTLPPLLALDGLMKQPLERTIGLTTQPSGTWVQTERAAHEKWAKLIGSHPKAAALMHVIVGNVGRQNALVASQKNLARMVGCTDRTVRRALEVLQAGNWIEVRQIGANGTTNAYVVNDRVAWSGNRDGIRYSLFSAAVLVSDDEQPDQDEIGALPSLARIPALYPGDRQLPTGPGLNPPTQPPLSGLEPDLPARMAAQTDIEDFTK